MQIIESSKNYDVVILGSGAGAGMATKEMMQHFGTNKETLLASFLNNSIKLI